MIINYEAEQSVLGAMLRSNKAVMLAVERLRPDDFGDPVHRELFDVMMAMAISSKKIDLVSVDEALTQRGKLEAIGGAEKIVTIATSVPSAANVGAYIDIVLEKANLRRLQAIAEAINRKTAAQDVPSDRIIELIEGACGDITERRLQRDGGWISGLEAAIKAYEAAENRVKPIPTGFDELDELLCGGLTKPELTVIGARPGKGKSAVLLTTALHAARNHYHVSYFSLEMSNEQIGQRELAASSLVGLTKQRFGGDKLTARDWELMSGGLERLNEAGIGEYLHIYQSYGLTIERLSNVAKHAVSRGEMQLLVLDYLQILRTAEKTRSEFERIGTISKNLKQLALMLDIPILAAVQVRRQSAEDTRKGGRAPTLDELRGSGDLEQDADNVLLIHSPENPEDQTLKHIAPEHEGIFERAYNAMANPFTIEVAKQRQGPTGRAWCLFKPMVMKFFPDKR